MKTLLPAILLLGEIAAFGQTSTPRLKESLKDFPRSELRLKNPATLTVDRSLSVKQMYDALAAAAGVNVIFDRDFRDSFNPSIRLDTTDALTALDLLSAQTGNFVEMLDAKTIIVSIDNATKRQQYQMQVIQTFHSANIAPMITTLRTVLNARYLATRSEEHTSELQSHS